MSYSIKELQKLLAQNPDLEVVDGNDRLTQTAHTSEREQPMATYAAQNGGYLPFASLSLPVHSEALITARNEHELQCQIIAECQRRAETNPAYSLLLSIPNGGLRNKAVAAKLKAEGLRAGLPDLFLPVARTIHINGKPVIKHGLWCELKMSPNKQTESQLWWQHRLRLEGYVCECVWDSVSDALNLIRYYLEG